MIILIDDPLEDEESIPTDEEVEEWWEDVERMLVQRGVIHKVHVPKEVPVAQKA